MQITFIIVIAVFLLLSTFASKISDRFGIPVLLLFLAIGMLAGSEGIGGIHFDDPNIAQMVSMFTFGFILFSGGFQTKWKDVRSVVVESYSLATIGVLLTALIVGLFAWRILGLTLLEGLLLGSIMSSTDAAAVFSVLRSKGVSLKGNLKPLLELESGSNDPMAMFLTIGLIELIAHPGTSPLKMILLFFQQMIIGAILGYLMGRLLALVINRIKLGYEGLYPVMSLGFVLLAFGLASLINGSGFLAVFIMGIVLNHVDVLHKRSLQRFHDGFAWLMQIALFLILGLFVFPSRLIPVAGASLLISLVMFFIARPLSVFLTLIFNPLKLNEKVFISWVGLRGAAPIILATFPMVAGLEQAELFYNVIFFVVLTSLLIQGTSLPWVARWLKLDKPIVQTPLYPIEYQPVPGMASEMQHLCIPADSNLINQTIKDLKLPDQFLITLIERDTQFIVPKGETVLQANDTLLALTDTSALHDVMDRFKLTQMEMG
ncbi:MAG: potassium/proton antiporter [Chloroflexi bacterium]|nr:potassium/proton antiporter [Chloroflexota bacterium]